MGALRDKYLKVKTNLSGEESEVAVSGGFLNILKDGKSVFVANVPSPNLLAERHSDTIIDNFEDFSDEDGEYEVFISSSRSGVFWEVGVEAKDKSRQAELESKFKIEYRPYYA